MRFCILGGSGLGGWVWGLWLSEDSAEKGDGESVGWDVEIKIDERVGGDGGESGERAEEEGEIIALRVIWVGGGESELAE